ncbi:MAG: hypothetical protein WC477_04615 [Patescibacteria group bacterium]
MKNKLTILCATAGTLLLPCVALAATPQQVLNSAIANTNTSAPMMTMGDLSVRTTETPLRSRTPSQDIKATMGVNTRVVPSQGSAEGTVNIQNVQGKSAGMTIQSTNNPGSIEWKVTAGKVYARVSQVSDSVLNALKMYGINVASAVGNWVEVDLSKMFSMSGDASKAASMAGVPVQQKDTVSLLTPKLLQVVSVEKRWKQGTDSMMRLRVRLNPTVINNAMNAELKKVDKKAKDAVAQRKAITAKYAEMKAFAAKVQLAVNVNVTKNAIDRVESFIRQVDPVKTCKLNKANKQVCSTTSNRVTEVRTGVTVRGASSNPVVAPANALTLEQVMVAAQNAMK